ncbi:MAG: hypothetical protein IRY98_07470, partial [Alicyclobacillaceae bacterium]|nr:hypothetical protein [Alicyclobacillaceae bacterium]
MKRWKAWGYAAGLFVLHKLVVWGGSLLFALQQHSPTPLLPFLKFAVIQNFTRWDSLWYIGIAAHGYRRTSAAFFPLFPFLIQQVHQWTGFSYQSSGWIIANVSFFLALWMLARLFLLDQNQSAAWRALLLLVLFPTAFFFSCAYTEPLFLFWTAGSLYFARTRKFWLSGIFGFFASLTRNTGVVLVLPFLYEYFRARDFRWTRIREDVLAVLMIPGGLAVYMG